MKFQKLIGTFLSVVALGWCFATMGCCGEEEQKARELEKKVAAFERTMVSMKSRIQELEIVEAEANACKTDLGDAKVELGKVGQQDNLVEKRLKTVKRLLGKLKKMIEAGDLSVRVRRGRMVLELPSAVLFQSGKAELSQNGESTLDSVADVLSTIPDRQFQVAGHTDNVPVSEDNPYGNNWHLSAARSVQVVMYLKKKGMNPRRLSAAGYAQFQPISPNKSKRGKARNRRIEITLMPNLAELPDLSRLEKRLGLSDPAEKK